MANKVATILGVVFLLIGVAGFAAPTLLGAHLSTVHNVVHLVTGAVSLWLGLKGSASAAKTFCLVFGAVYVLLGIAGFVAGEGADRTLTLGPLMLGTMDHIIHVLLGVIYLIGGLMTRAAVAVPAR